MENNTGFTLVELIAVVIILGLIGLVTFPAVSGVLRGAKKDVKEVNVDTILNAAYDLAQKDSSILPSVSGSSGEEVCVSELVMCGLLKGDIYKEVEDSANATFTVTYCGGNDSSACSIEGESSKFFGNYLFQYHDNSSKSCSNLTCRYKAGSSDSNS